MRIIRHPRKKRLSCCVVALGTFDGVHRGHQKVLTSAVQYAKKIKAASLAITFDPHPQIVISPERGLRLLTTLKEREELFCKLGIDGVVVIPFNQRVRALSYQAFVKKYLVDRLGVAHVFVGYDYAFGRGRQGDIHQLRQLGRKYGFSVTIIPPVSIKRKVVKSRLIREMLNKAKFSEACNLLGHAYQITGKVKKGRGRGKGLGFPTANLKVDARKLIPAHGVYVGLVNGRKCVVNIGVRPTFGVNQTEIEVHIINFNGNIRGKNLEVVLQKRLRDEKHFSDVEKLKLQIKKDVSRALDSTF